MQRSGRDLYRTGSTYSKYNAVTGHAAITELNCKPQQVERSRTLHNARQQPGKLHTQGLFGCYCPNRQLERDKPFTEHSGKACTAGNTKSSPPVQGASQRREPNVFKTQLPPYNKAEDTSLCVNCTKKMKCDESVQKPVRGVTNLSSVHLLRNVVQIATIMPST